MKSKTQMKNLLWAIPAVVAFFIALIPTLKYQWPLTVDIFYHIHVAQVYSQYGLTLTDPLIDPGMGHKIGYMPLFALVIAFLGTVFHTDYFTVARALQPVLAFSVVLSVSYVAKKFYGDIAGISAGFLIMSSYLFSRLVSPLPETMALIFIPLAVYCYYKSVEDKKHFYAFLSGFMFLIVLATHQAATMILFLVITAVAVVMTLLRRKIRFFTSYLAFLSVPIGFGVLATAVVFLMAPGFAYNLLTQGLVSVTGLITSLNMNEPISNLKYIAYIGISLLFAVVGGIFALKKRRDQDVIIFTWIIVTFLISKAYWFGINVLSIRVLVYLLLPFSILGGLGLSYLYENFKKKEFPSLKIRSSFLIVTFIVATLFAVVTVEDPNFGKVPKYSTVGIGSVNLESPQIVPPTNYDIDLANWFNKNGDKKSVLISNNYYTAQFLLATTKQPIGSVSTSVDYFFEVVKSNETNNLGYIVYDKRLIFTSQQRDKPLSTGELTFLNEKKGMHSFFNLKMVYQNKDYIIFKYAS